MDIKFRKCTLDDFDFLFELKKQNFKKYVDNIWGWNDLEQLKRMRIDLNEHLSHKRIIIYNGIEIGVYAYHITDDGTYFINEINLLKEYQCKGIGTKILKDVLEKNKNDNIRTILQVFKDNPAINLYKRLGFVIYDETETHYRMEVKCND